MVALARSILTSAGIPNLGSGGIFGGGGYVRVDRDDVADARALLAELEAPSSGPAGDDDEWDADEERDDAEPGDECDEDEPDDEYAAAAQDDDEDGSEGDLARRERSSDPDAPSPPSAPTPPPGVGPPAW